MSAPRLTPIAEALPSFVPFTGPEVQERRRGRPFRARLGANESHFGPSPKAIEAMREAAAECWKYGDSESYALKAAIARHHGVAPENVVIGEGIDGLMSLVVRLMLEPGAPAVTSDGGYPTFNYHVAGQGGRLVKVPFTGDREDLGALAEAARREQAPLLFVSNPNNPMGSWWSAGEIQRLIADLPPGVLLLLDEAYADTAPPEAIPPFDANNPQVLRLRTFSKAYGLAGRRARLPRSKIRRIWRRPWRASPPPRRASPASPWTTASSRCPRPPISSPLIAGATAPLPSGCWTASSPAMCSCASQWWRRWTAVFA
jgi:histidinol-phosphate aminotransferase